MRLGKQFSIEVSDKLETSYGTTNRLNPQVIFINGKFWLQPTCEMDYDNILNEIISSIKTQIKNSIKTNSLWENKMIFDMDIKTQSMSPNKKKYGDFEIYLKQDKNKIVHPNQLKDELYTLLHPILNNFIQELHENGFIITQNKK